MKRFRRGRFIVVIAASLGVAATVMYFETWPTRSRIQVAQSDLARLENELATEQAFLLQAKNTGERNSSLEAERTATFRELVTTDSIEHFVDLVSNEMEASGFTHAQVAPVIEELLSASTFTLGNVRLTQLRFAVEAQARAVEIGRFLERLEQQRYFSGISSMVISHNDGTNPEVLCQFQFAAYLRGTE